MRPNPLIPTRTAITSLRCAPAKARALLIPDS
jgi:hypothetical protein